jgi:translation initiation factor IF-1
MRADNAQLTPPHPSQIHTTAGAVLRAAGHRDARANLADKHVSVSSTCGKFRGRSRVV